MSANAEVTYSLEGVTTVVIKGWYGRVKFRVGDDSTITLSSPHRARYYIEEWHASLSQDAKTLTALNSRYYTLSKLKGYHDEGILTIWLPAAKMGKLKFKLL